MSENPNLPIPLKANELTTISNSSWPSKMATDLLNLHGKNQVSTIQYVTFECDNLESHLCEILNCSKSKITRNDLTQIDILVARNKNITSLKGIEHATKLKKIDFGVNQIKSIAPLISILGLEKVVLAKNQIQELSGIEQLKNLTELNFRDNPIDQIKPLNQLIHLKNLVLTNVPVHNFNPISNLKNLELLSLGWSFDYESMDNFCSDELYEILQKLRNLKELHLGEEPISESQILKLRKKLPNCLIPDNH